MKRALIVLVTLMLLFSLTACRSADYKKAVEAMDGGKYAEALSILEPLKEYKDSAERMKKCTYELGREAFLTDAFAEAKQYFSSLGDYDNSAEMVKKCDYSIAGSLLKQGAYEEAVAILDALGDYSDSADLAREARDKILLGKVTGTWITDPMTMDLASELNLDEIMNGASLSPLKIQLEITFTENGEYVFSVPVDEESFKTVMKEVTAAMTPFYMAVIEQALEDEGYTMEDLYAELGTDDPDTIITQMMGMTVEELVDTMDIDSLLEDAGETGSFRLENGAVVAGFSENPIVYNAEDDTILLVEEAVDIFGTNEFLFHRK